MSGRHSAQRARRRPIPTALAAAALLSSRAAALVGLALGALGLVGSHPAVAAAGAVCAAAGVAVETMQSRAVGRRLRRERVRHRLERNTFSVALEQMRHQIQQLTEEVSLARRAVLDTRPARPAPRADAETKPLRLRSAVPGLVGPPLVVAPPTVQPRAQPQPRVEPEHHLVPEPWTARATTATPSPGAAARTRMVAAIPPRDRRAAPMFVPRSVPGVPARSQAAPAGASPVTPLRGVAAVIDLRGIASPTTSPLPLPVGAVEDRVYAALATADADELTLTLEGTPGAPPAEGRHVGPPTGELRLSVAGPGRHTA